MESNWISVKDSLPPNDNDVLAYVEYDNFPITAYHRGGIWHAGYQVQDYFKSDGCIDSALHKYNVTHWQPLPSPPKELIP